MIVSKTPLRIPLAGGLSDIRPYAERFGGATVSCTIDKYAYVVLKAHLGDGFDLRYQDVHEKAADAAGIRHDLIREALGRTGLERTPLEIVILTDLRSESGLGSSGAVTVGLLHALYGLRGEPVDAARLLREAGYIEVEALAGASGYHDPAICALGGLKLIEYRGAEVGPRAMAVSAETLAAFEASLLLFYSGRHAKSKPSLDLLGSHLEEALPLLHDIKALAYALEAAFAAADLAAVAAIIGEQQALKQRLPGHFVDDYVVDVTRRVRAQGAFAQLPGGKISAFVLVCCPDGQQEEVRRALSDLREIPFRLSHQGSRVVEI